MLTSRHLCRVGDMPSRLLGGVIELTSVGVQPKPLLALADKVKPCVCIVVIPRAGVMIVPCTTSPHSFFSMETSVATTLWG